MVQFCFYKKLTLCNVLLIINLSSLSGNFSLSYLLLEIEFSLKLNGTSVILIFLINS